MKLARFICFCALRFAWAPLTLALAACSDQSTSGGQSTLPLPTGHYEGPIAYQGSELRVALDLRPAGPGQLQAEVSFPQLPGLEFGAASLSYKEPQLRLEQSAAGAGGISVQAIREGDFLRGILRWDSVQADFVWARRGEVPPRGFREQALKVRSATHFAPSRLLLPDDTLDRHPALVLLTTPATASAATSRARYLVRRGFVALLVPAATTEAPDTAAAQTAVAAWAALRRQAGVDSNKVGYWGRGPTAPVAAGAAARVQPPAAFVVLEGPAANTREAAVAYQPLARRRVPVLAMYAGLDTTVNLRESPRRLRNALSYRRTVQLRTFPQATADFIRPGHAGPGGQWQWPKSVPGYWEGLTEWLRQVTK